MKYPAMLYEAQEIAIDLGSELEMKPVFQTHGVKLENPCGEHGRTSKTDREGISKKVIAFKML